MSPPELRVSPGSVSIMIRFLGAMIQVYGWDIFADIDVRMRLPKKETGGRLKPLAKYQAALAGGYDEPHSPWQCCEQDPGVSSERRLTTAEGFGGGHLRC